MTAPEISIVMPVYNAEPYLKEAIESILNQTYDNFEFIIINDGSNDKSLEIIKHYKDSRIRFISRENRGLVLTLNEGIELAAGEYIVRQDADDRSTPNRLQLQLQYLKANQHTVLLGSSMDVMDESGAIKHRHAVLLNDPELRQELLVRSPFAHGSVIFQKKAAIESGLYRQQSWPAEDYDFWLRLSNYGKLANIDEALYVYREHSDSISNRQNTMQLAKTKEVHELAWLDRRRLISKQPINLRQYKTLDMGAQRIERIISNIQAVSRLALQKKDQRFALKNALLLARDPLSYRKMAGKIKRRIRS